MRNNNQPAITDKRKEYRTPATLSWERTAEFYGKNISMGVSKVKPFGFQRNKYAK